MPCPSIGRSALTAALFAGNLQAWPASGLVHDGSSSSGAGGAGAWLPQRGRDLDDGVSLLQIISDLKHEVSSMQKASTASASDRREHARATSGRIPGTVLCILILVIQYFALHVFALAVEMSSTWWDVRIVKLKAAAKALTLSSHMIPMICVLIILLQLRAEQLTDQHQPLTYGIPQWWVEYVSLVMVVAGIVARVFMFTSVMTAHPQDIEGGGLSSRFFAGCNFLSLLVQYLGIVVMLVGCVAMDEPFDIWLQYGRLRLPASMACMVIIVLQFFFVYLIVFMSSSVQELSASGPQAGASTIAVAAKAGAEAQFMAPTIGILLTVARLRALRVGGSQFAAPAWARFFFYLAVYGALFNTLLAAFEVCLQRFASGDIGKRSGRFPAATFLQGLAELSVLVSAAGIFLSVLLLRGSNGQGPAPGLSATTVCVLGLVAQHFGVNLLTLLGGALARLRGRSTPEPSLEPGAAAEGAVGVKEATVACPVLCALFFAVRVRVNQVSFGGSPPWWVEGCMYLCTWATLLRLLLSLAAPAPDEPAAGVEAGAGRHEPPPTLKALVACQGLCVAAISAGVVGVICGVVQMSPATVRLA
mmetsp:Transcript_84904/g.263709  ORF Transcript_84904/g.263709 Transcript_84904/m.263709 type:complete len:589 (-) Transcript_84904:192-1958(-)